MNSINLLSLTLFCIFFICYVMKLVILSKASGIRAYVLGRSGKSTEVLKVEALVKIATFVWGLLWLVLSLAGAKSGCLVLQSKSFDLLRYLGIVLLTVGVAMFITAMISMKTSWRVGIDKESKTSLITGGIYKFTRNPAFVGFDTMFAGFALTFPGLLTLIVAIANILAIHKLILLEEAHLNSVFGRNYEEYKRKTPRYILF
ncbi:MAG TPA: isoprenylcysteine carboxylmethyltransferase family protein [Ruminiclostridium sp.]|nr:isoprenylcysteine carboxylmethyltransferase family protein [Ruminiclostridium sp.]